MPQLSLASLDVLATSVFLGGAVLLLAFALFSYMGLLPLRASARRPAFYAGKHVVVTGGSSGIGKELARLLVASGASVTLVARNAQRLADAARELEPPDESRGAAKRVNTATADCSDAAKVNAMVDDIERMFGPIDILVNSAGCGVGAYFESSDEAAFRSQMDANYYTQLFPTHAVFKKMAERRNGHIVFVSSMAGLTGLFGQSAYSSAKFAIRGLAEAIYYEGKPFGIDVTIAYPPDTDTPGLQQERQTMPPETLEISDTGGLFSAARVATQIADGVMRKKFRVTIGVIGNLLGILTAGLTPGVSLWDVLLVPITRAITPFFLWDINRAVRRGHANRFPDYQKDAKQ